MPLIGVIIVYNHLVYSHLVVLHLRKDSLAIDILRLLQIFIYADNVISRIGIKLHYCSPHCAKAHIISALLTGQTVVNIPNPINTNLFKPRNRQEARIACELPANKKLILFGAVKITDKRKGIDYFIESCNMLVQKHPELKEELGVVVMGNHSEELKPLLPFEVYSLNYISNEKEVVNIYNAVDIYVTPSLEENLPNTIMEAMACGTPCVGFQVGGIPEMIDHLHNGYVAEYKSADDLANGIYWILNEGEYADLSEAARRKVLSSYSESTIAKKYIDIYNKITGNHA